MMKQYLAIKAEHEGCLLFFRLGDFYELFFDDAEETAKLLGLTLTGRGKGETRVPMCGVPHHAAEGYIAKLTKLGKKVAICDQVSDPSEPGIVQREVTRIVTPGTTLDEKVLDAKKSNYVAAVMEIGGGFALAFADVTTGEFGIVRVADVKALGAELQRLGPSELVVSAAELESDWVDSLKRMRDVFVFGHASEAEKVEEFLMDYLKETQKTNLDHMVVGEADEIDFMALDEATLKNLELMETLREGKKEGSLLWVIDKTETAMGGRLLRYFLTHPLVDAGQVARRLDAVEELVKERALAEDVRGVLGSILDMERLLARLSMNRGSARDLAALKQSLQQIPTIQQLLSASSDGKGAKTELLAGIRDGIDPLSDIVTLIEKAIVEEPPLTFNDGGVIADGYHTELDELKKISREGKSYIQKMQQEEIARTGISNLKVRYNKVFGYYLEVSKSHVSKVPETWIRKQTLVNAERYITPELKEYEEKVLGAEEKIVALEQQLFAEVRAQVVAEKDRIQKTAKKLALLDVLQSFAAAALMNRYCKPTVKADGDLNIVNGRHPVVEEMSFAARFVPNDTALLNSGERVQL
ncbi:MAG TPA: DNA mismatch repair protein MutS, partial [Candidatus Gracilibacteria bacterium]|nr:DNA mismatch repair protein MutS [Candidatus Gracilibacteria bacterium]